MKNLISFCFLSVALLSSAALSAQVVFNPKVGFNVSAIDARLQDIRAEARYGWNAGVDLRVGDGLLFLRPGLHFYNFTANLFQDVNGPNDVPLKDETTIQSLKLPLNAGLRITGEGGLVGLHVHGGVTPSYILGVRERSTVPFVKDDLKDFTWGANFGLTADILLFTVDANYELGMTPFFDAATGKNNVLTLSVGMKF